MSLLPPFKRVLKEDMKGSASWIDPFLNSYNSAIEFLASLLTGNLTFTENILSQIKDMTFTTLPTYSSGDWTNITFPRALKTRSSGLTIQSLVDQTTGGPITKAFSPSWSEINGNMIVNFISGLENSRNYFVRFLII